jgi:hypothetical protein
MKHVVVMVVQTTILLSCLALTPWTSEPAAATPNTVKSCEEGKNSLDRENCEVTEALSKQVRSLRGMIIR